MLFLLLSTLAAAQTKRPLIEGNRRTLPSTTPASQRFFDVLALEAKIDASHDEFRSEHLAMAAEKIMRGLLADLGRADLSATDSRFRTTTIGQPLIGANLQEVFNDGFFQVQRPDKSGSTSPQAPLGERLRNLRRVFGPWNEVEAWVDEVSGDFTREFECRFFLTLSFNDTSPRRQLNLRWSTRWEASANLLLLDARAESSELIRANDILLIDQTDQIIGPNAPWRNVLDTGADELTSRLDRNLGVDFLGHIGLSVGDVDGDGRDDLWVGTQGGLPNLLLLQQPDGTVVEAAATRGVDFLDLTRSALLVDVDNDGDRDLVMAMRNATVIYLNDGKGNFSSVPLLRAATGSAAEFYSMCAADWDKNGLLDFYSVRYVSASYGVSVPLPYFDAKNGPSNLLLSNLGEGRFRDDTTTSGVGSDNTRFSLAASFEDLDNDGDFDLYVANDFGRSNLLVQENGKFQDLADERGALNHAAGMGISFADLNHDGIYDLYISNMYSPAGRRHMNGLWFQADDLSGQRAMALSHVIGNSLFISERPGFYQNRSDQVRPEVNGWSWGAMFVDLNGDGHEDLLVPNGNLSGTREPDLDSFFWRQVASRSPWIAEPSRPYENGWAALSRRMASGHSWAGHQRNATYLNLGDGSFADISTLSGFGFRDDSRALALSDWDRDGDIDIWVRNRTSPGLRYLNNRSRELRPHTALRIETPTVLDGTPHVGARISVKAGNRRWMRSVRAGDGYLAQSSDQISIGLGGVTQLDEVKVTLSNGRVFEFKDIQTNQILRLSRDGSMKLAPFEARKPGDVITTPTTVRVPPWTGLHLNERLPLPPLTFLDAEQRAISTDQLLGRPWLLVFWSESSDGSLKVLQELRAAAVDLAKEQISVIPVNVDADDRIQAAREAISRIDLSMPFLRADPLLLDLVDLIQQDLLARPDDLVLPSVFCVDRLGLLSAVFRSEGRVPEWTSAARRPADTRFPFVGRATFNLPRGWNFLVSELRRRGQRDAALFYQAILKRVGSGR